ncbi:MAG: FMN-binding protein [Ruminococcaceae bacterium]|nr:FMN-binding protein [Oscillospiraceae bacterium]
MTFKKTFLPALILAAICLVSAAALALTNHLTHKKIAEAEREKYFAAAAAVLPEGALLQELAHDGVEGFVARRPDSTVLGYAVKASAKGYGGDVLCVVGFDPTGKIIGISVDAPDETPGLGNNVTKPSFTDQLIGMTKPPVLGEDFDAVTSATYSSRAVEMAVAEAYATLDQILKGE